jgi:hypothetical protein
LDILMHSGWLSRRSTDEVLAVEHFGWFLLLVATAPILLPAETRKMTVAQLQDVLTGLHNSQKSDEQMRSSFKTR